MKLVPLVKAQWLAALRSGEYEQGRGMLQKKAPEDDERIEGDSGKPSFCCLGVLCVIYAKSHPESYWKDVPNEPGLTFHVPYGGHGQTSMSATQLPEIVANWAFGAEPYHVIRSNITDPNIEGHLLSSWNDGFNEPTSAQDYKPAARVEGKTFEDIAKLIEEHL